MTEDTIDVRRLARAVRFAFVAGILAFSYFGVRASLSIENFMALYKDMLGSHPLPLATVFVIKARGVIVALSLLIPVAAVATLFWRKIVTSFYVFGILGFLAIVQFIALGHALGAPLAQIIQMMGGQADGGK